MRTRPLILVADRAAYVGERLARRLRQSGYDVLLTQDGSEAMGIASAQRPDVALIDVELPGVDGYELIRRLRCDPELEATPIVSLGGNHAPGADATLGRALAAGEVEEAVARLLAR